jgi:hypothetical protein
VGEVVKETVGVPQLSDAVGAVQLAIAQLLVVVKLIFVGQLVKVGGVASVSHGSVLVTVTVKEQVAELPFASVALYETVVVPTGKHEPIPKPDVGEVVKDTVGVPQLSDAVGAVQLAIAQLLVVVKLIFVGQLVKVGGVASVSHGSVLVTVTVKEQVAELPLVSVAL